MLPRTLPVIRRAPFAFKLRAQPLVAGLHTQPRPTSLALPALARVQPCCQYKLLPRLGVRGVASEVSNKPGSQTPGQAATNIKEEVSNTAGSVARSIAGANVTVDSVKPMKPTDDSFVSLSISIWLFVNSYFCIHRLVSQALSQALCQSQ